VPPVVVYYLQDSILHNTVYWPTQVFVAKKDVKRVYVCGSHSLTLCLLLCNRWTGNNASCQTYATISRRSWTCSMMKFARLCMARANIERVIAFVHITTTTTTTSV